MTLKRNIGLVIILLSIFVLLSSYLFTTPDTETKGNPRLSELVISDGIYTINLGDGFKFQDTSWSVRIDKGYVISPTFYGFTIRYNYLATICLLFFLIGLYIFVVFQNKNEKS